MTGPLVERLQRYLTLANGKALVPVLPRDLREAADTIAEAAEALIDAKITIEVTSGKSRAVRPAYDDTLAKIDALLTKIGDTQ